MIVQMDAEFKKEQIGTLFVRVGAPEGGFRGGGVRGVQPKKCTCPSSKKILPPVGVLIFCHAIPPFRHTFHRTAFP